MHLKSSGVGVLSHFGMVPWVILKIVQFRYIYGARKDSPPTLESIAEGGERGIVIKLRRDNLSLNFSLGISIIRKP